MIRAWTAVDRADLGLQLEPSMHVYICHERNNDSILDDEALHAHLALLSTIAQVCLAKLVAKVRGEVVLSKRDAADMDVASAYSGSRVIMHARYNPLGEASASH